MPLLDQDKGIDESLIAQIRFSQRPITTLNKNVLTVTLDPFIVCNTL